MIDTKGKDEIYLNIAREYSKFSKCVSMQVGAIFVSGSGKVIGTGVNGTAPGTPNCCDVFDKRCPEHSAWSEEHEIHAEMNLILDVVRNGNFLNHSGAIKLYCTHNPCSNCLKHIIALKCPSFVLTDVVFAEQYYRTSDEQLEKMKTDCLKKGILLRGINH